MMNQLKRTGALLAVAAVAACGSPAPAVPAVDLGRMANPVTPQAPTGGVTTPVAPAPDTPAGDYTVAVDTAATVRFAVADDRIDVVDVGSAAGWQQVRDERGLREVEMAWVRGTTAVSLDAELDDGRFDTDVDIDFPAPGGEYTFRVGDAGSVTVDVLGDRVTLVRQEAAPGWVATVDERELAEGEVEIRFRADGVGSTVDFDADVDDDGLNIDIDTQTGRGYTAPPVR